MSETLIIVAFNSKTAKDINNMLGIVDGQGSVVGSIGTVLPKVIAPLSGIGATGGTLTVHPDDDEHPSDTVVYSVGAAAPYSGGIYIAITSAIASKTLMDMFSCKVGGGLEQKGSITTLLRAVNFLSNIGTGVIAGVVVSQGIVTGSADQWKLDGGIIS